MKNYIDPLSRFMKNLNLDKYSGINIESSELALLQRYSNIIDAVIENEACFIGLYDLTKTEKQYVFVSNGCRRILSYSPEEILNQGFGLAVKIVHPDDLERLLQFNIDMNNEFIKLSFDQVKEKIYSIENRIIQKNGNIIWMRSHSQLLTKTKDGMPQLVFFINTDVTNEKNLDLELIEKSKIEKELIEKNTVLMLNKERNEKEIYRLELEKLKIELQYKEQELAQYALNLATKNDCMRRLEKNFKSIKNLANTELQEKLNEMIGLMKDNISIEKAWDRFQTQFNNINQRFIHKVTKNFPGLTPTEINIISLLRLQMKPKDIAMYKYVSLSNVQNHMGRIRKKLGLGRKDNIAKFLMEI